MIETKNAVPETIQTMIQQTGGRGLGGAFVYIGARGISYKCPKQNGECRPSKSSSLLTGEPGSLEYEVGIQVNVNGKRGKAWKLIVAYEPDDTYTVWLVESHSGRHRETMVLACLRDVYCTELQATVERAYDEAIKKHCGGFIPMG